MYAKLFSGKILFLLCVGILSSIYIVGTYAGNGYANVLAVAFSNLATADCLTTLNVSAQQETGATWYLYSNMSVVYQNPTELKKYMSDFDNAYIQETGVYEYNNIFNYYFTPARGYKVYGYVSGTYSKISPGSWSDSDEDEWP